MFDLKGMKVNLKNTKEIVNRSKCEILISKLNPCAQMQPEGNGKFSVVHKMWWIGA